MLRVLHTGDWHLGRTHAGVPAAARRALERARFEAVERIVALGERLEVDALLCAGDLFDTPAPPLEVTEPLAEILETTSRPLVLLPGNHDPADGRAASPWHPDHPFRRALPAHVRVVESEGFELELDGGVIVGSPCRSTAGALSVAERLPARPEGDPRVRIGVAHGSTFSGSSPFPVDPSAVDALELDYLALGDHHGLEVRPGPTTIAYAGTPEQTRFGERDAGHVILAQVERGRVHWQAERVRRWSWRALAITQLAELEALVDDPLETTVLRVSLDLCASPPEHARIEAALRRLGRRAGALMVRREGLRLDLGRASEPVDALGPMLADAGRALLAEARAGDEVAERALRHLFRLVGEVEGAP